MEASVLDQEQRFSEWRARRDAKVAAYKASPAGQAEFAKRSAAAKKAAATRAARKAAEAEVAASIEPAKVGDIFSSSWGYDQTNVDFFEVVEVSATGKTVKVVGIGSEVVGQEGGPSDRVIARSGSGNIEKAFRVHLSPSGWGDKQYWGFKVNSYTWASAWDGTPMHQTGWGHGH